MAKPAPDYRKLPIPERLQLVEDIWNSIAEDAKTLPLSDEQRAQLDRRWAEHERDPSSAISWDEVRSSTSPASDVAGFVSASGSG